MSKKDKKQLPQEVYGKNYLLKNGRNLPIYKCLISENAGLVSTAVIRRLPNAKFAIGVYLIDRFCLGLKSTSFRIDFSTSQLEDLIETIEGGAGFLEECTYVTVHNWVYGGIAYAEDLGFKPDPDFGLSKYLLEDDTEDIELIEFEFGKDGKPFFFQGPYDDGKKIMQTLQKNVGSGNFDYLALV